MQLLTAVTSENGDLLGICNYMFLFSLNVVIITHVQPPEVSILVQIDAATKLLFL